MHCAIYYKYLLTSLAIQLVCKYLKGKTMFSVIYSFIQQIFTDCLPFYFIKTSMSLIVTYTIYFLYKLERKIIFSTDLWPAINSKMHTVHKDIVKFFKYAFPTTWNLVCTRDCLIWPVYISEEKKPD